MAGKKGCSGRRKTSTAVKKRRGTTRTDRKKKEIKVSSSGHPLPPKHLREDVKQEWNRLAPLLAESGMLTSVDLLAFEMGMLAYNLWREAVDQLQVTETILESEKGQPYPHPLVWIEKSHWERVLKFCGQFGLTPAARSGLSIETEKKDETDPLEDAFQ